jgi:tRNA pseudouridine32 synthase/23S rRNA pseudouridine746 synthase
MSSTHYHFRSVTGGETAISALATCCPLSKLKLKDAMQKGAVWLKRGRSSKRLRRATTLLQAGDVLALHYDADLLEREAPAPQLVADEGHYSVWDKPAGLLAQGTLEGDHCSLLRLAERQLGRETLLVHRLDREASGLMLVAHSPRAAALLSALFAREGGPLTKLYRVEVRGALPARGSIEAPLDGKSALTRYTRLAHDATLDCSLADVELVTGRKHQIRRHFAGFGCPVLGDPRYGSGNRDPRGLQLRAVRLRFECPLSRRHLDYQLP